MNRLKKRAFLFGLLPLLSGCIVRSLHPLYTDENVIFEEGLVGQWMEEGSKEVWEFSRQGAQRYKCVIHEDDGKRSILVAHLLEIEGKRFLDFFPAEPDGEEGIFYQLHTLPLHTFTYVRQIEPVLQMSFPSSDWLQELLEKNPGAIRHEQLGKDDIFLTASTGALQTFWLAHLNTEGAFDELSNFQRSRSTQ